MNKPFDTIALVGLPRSARATATHALLYHWLRDEGYNVLLERSVAQVLAIDTHHAVTLSEIGQQADLAIVVGGDGNMLSAAQILARHDIALIGVNRGNLGFLTDIDPAFVQQQLAAVLAGDYLREQRFLLEAMVSTQTNQSEHRSLAINEIVLHPDKVAHIIEFEVYIDGCFAFAQRSDGLIIATPTGSTAYSLSGGGPILIPTLNVMVLVPMFPHTLSSRPLVINGDSQVQLYFSGCPENHSLQINCDSQIKLPICLGEHVVISKSPSQLSLIHPAGYDYFNRLSAKLGWLKKLF